MKILLTGSTGQLGQAVREVFSTHDVVPLAARLEDSDALEAEIRKARPDWVLHAAAFTDVDGCERDPVQAARINVEATTRIATTARDVDARMLYVSTDYVFDGTRGGYREEDDTAPASVYGKTKLAGEEATRAVLEEHALVARTSVVYGPHKRNFVTWLIDALSKGEIVRVVHDQRVSPTYTADLARMLLALIEHGAQGIWHTAGGSTLTRLEMAHEIARVFDLDPAPIRSVDSASLAWVAPRPHDSTLDVTKMRRLHEPLTFQQALHELKERMRR